MVKIIRYFFIGLLVVNCAEKQNSTKHVFFAGEIVNPTSDQVVLYKGEKSIDSVKLDENNRFVFTLDSVAEGLHHFYHHPELQYVFLENGDSLQIRLNTSDFDESLVFSGKGEEINNFLLEMFLANEEEEDLVYSLYKLEPESFHQKIDSLLQNKIQLLEQTMTEFEISPKAYELAKAGIVYNANISMEAYPFYHRRRSGEDNMHDLPEDFYDYRASINYNNDALTYLRPYYNFMKYHLGNLAYNQCKNNCGSSLEVVSRQLHFNKHKLKLIDSLITQEELRDNLFRNVAIDYLLKHDTEEHNIDFIAAFQELSKNNRHNKEINTLYQGIINMQPSKSLPQLTLTNYAGNEIMLSGIDKGKEVVFYFWSAAEPGHFRNIMKRVEELKLKRPEYRFVGISLRTDQARWKSMVETYNLDKNEQYWANDFDKAARALIVYNPNKSIIAKDGIIIDAFANIYRSF